MVRFCLLLAVALAACGQPDATPASQTQADAAPPEFKPSRAPWLGEAPPAGSGHIEGGAVRATAKVSVLQLPFPEHPWLKPLAPDSFVTATLARPLNGALHHRFSGVLRQGMSWPGPGHRGTPCPAIGSLTCFAFSSGRAYVQTDGRAVNVELITHGKATEASVLDAARTEPRASVAPALVGDVVMHSDNLALASAIASRYPAAFDLASIEIAEDSAGLRARLRWTPASPWSAKRSTSPAPSWDALCSGALACARTGPWPNIFAWLEPLGGTTPPPTSGLAPLSMWSSTWPHALADSLVARRNGSPKVARGFITSALTGLAEVEFAGARLDADGVFVAFVRLPATWVNAAASLLPYAGLTPRPEPVGDTEITWAPLRRGGIALALDEGPEPAMGWIVAASSPDRFAWLMDAPRTLAGPSALDAQVARVDTVAGHLPQAWRPWLEPYGGHSGTVRVEIEAGSLSVTASLATPR